AVAAAAMASVVPAPSPALAQSPSASCAPARTALVLSGGAAKGFAHIGVLEVLDSIGIKPDLIVGSSVGALVGSLYASGYAARQVDSALRALPFESVVRTYDPTVAKSIGLLKPLAVWERGANGYRLQTGAARAGEVNTLIAAVTLRGNVLARGNFDSLPIPFRAIATNLATGRAVVLDHGDLGLAVRASVSLPLIFQPVRQDSLWLSDGGLAENTPIAAARAAGAERVWVSRLPSAPPDPNTFDDPFALSETLIGSLFKEDTSLTRAGDVSIVNPTYAFGPFDFRRTAADSLRTLGHQAAVAAFAAATCLRPVREDGGQPRITIPATVTSVTSPDSAAERPVLAQLGITAGAPFDLERTRRSLVALGSVERIRAVWLNPAGSGAQVTFAPVLETAPRRAIGLGVAFDQFLSGRLWIGGVDRHAFDLDAEGTMVARFGAYEQDLLVALRPHADVIGEHRPFAAGVRLVHESVRLFVDAGELPSAETQEGEVFAGLQQNAEAGAWRYELLADSRLWREPGRDTRGTWGLRAAAFRAAGDYEMGSVAEALAFTDYQRARVDASRTFALGGVDVRLRARAGWGNRLPVQQEFTLGGADGFAGLRIGELRGSQEAFGSMRLSRLVAPQIRLAVEAMAGAIGDGSGFLVQRPGTHLGELHYGVRTGLEAATPIGPIRVEEGFANTGARGLLVRVGHWF
ncbi:MAG: patatin-like phospholipase family protein, partial [Gemmatimonadota bacterium]|nr:patatin-like phospholipase family protein [Gemmatimonadota bacterium]